MLARRFVEAYGNPEHITCYYDTSARNASAVETCDPPMPNGLELTYSAGTKGKEDEYRSWVLINKGEYVVGATRGETLIKESTKVCIDKEIHRFMEEKARAIKIPGKSDGRR